MKKHEDTDTFHFYNANPKGLRTSDCVVRALSLATGRTWDTVMYDLNQYAFKMKMIPNEEKLYKKYLKDNGWMICPQPRKLGGKKFTGKDFVRTIGRNGELIVHIGCGHIACVKDGKIWDTWDCSVGNYWVKI